MLEVREDTPLQQPALHQFVKFCIVGAVSFAIDFGISFVLVFYAGVGLILAKTISFTLAVTNGFYWNRRWTFQAVGRRRQRDQYAMFFAVNIIGWILNVGIVNGIVEVAADPSASKLKREIVFLAATLVATAVVVFWNFFANKHWTFKHPNP